jgi:hypothetical protein
MAWTRCPDGGLHLLYRCERPFDGKQLAWSEGGELLVEVLGAGALITEAPSPGACHPTGKPYVRKRGSLATLPWVDPVIRDHLAEIGRGLSRLARPVTPSPKPCRRNPLVTDAGERPGDLVNRTFDVVAALLGAEWAIYGHDRDGHVLLVRPGKARKDGPSATFGLGEVGNLLYVHSSDATPLKPGLHTPFAVFSTLFHAGDFAAAARAVRVNMQAKKCSAFSCETDVDGVY